MCLPSRTGTTTAEATAAEAAAYAATAAETSTEASAHEDAAAESPATQMVVVILPADPAFDRVSAMAADIRIFRGAVRVNLYGRL